MKKINSIFLLIFIISMGCHNDDDKTVTKDTSTDVEVSNDSSQVTTECTNIEVPGNYFPGVPNTWWKYIDHNTNTITYHTSSEYVYDESQDKCLPILYPLNSSISDQGLVHSFAVGLGKTGTMISPIYSLHLDSVLTCSISFARSKKQTALLTFEDILYKRITTNLDTNLVVNGKSFENVIEVYEYSIADNNLRYFEYFAKDIGLIRRDSLSVNDSTQRISILSINDYFIGK